MNLEEYFANAKGRGMLATADDQGRVNAAIYALPHVINKDTVAFIMSDRLSHENLQSNPYAAYLFMEDGPGWKGQRLYLEKIGEERNTELARSMIRRSGIEPKQVDVNLVFFKLEKVLPLVGVMPS